MIIKNSLILGTLLSTLMTAGFAAAQVTRAPAPVVDAPILCPYPVVQHVSGGTSATPVPSEFPSNVRPVIVGSVWNQTHPDKAFGHTFRFPAQRKDCCVLTGGKLTIHIKALVGGPGPTSNNDAMNVYVGAISIWNQSLWPSTVAAGDTYPLTIPISANHLTTGLLSIYFEDDTAVVSADLELDWCCLTKQP